MKTFRIEGSGVRLVCPRCELVVRTFDTRDLGFIMSEAVMHECRLPAVA